MAKIQANAAGLHQINHDYNRSGLGTFGPRDVKIGKANVHLRSSKSNPVKNLFSRMADILPGNNGKVRSYNRDQKEFSRQLGQFLGHVGVDGAKGAVDSLVSDLAKLNRQVDKMDSKVKGFDAQAFVAARLDVHLAKMTPRQLTNVLQALRNQKIDLTAPNPRAERVDRDFGSIGLGATTGDIKGQIAAEAKQAADLLKEVFNKVEDAAARKNSAQYGMSVNEAKAIMGSGADDKLMSRWASAGIRLPNLAGFLQEKIEPEDARRINNGGMTAADYKTLTGAPLNLSHDAAVQMLESGCNTREIGKLQLSGMSQQEAIEYASSGCSLSAKTALEAKGLSKPEILAFMQARLDPHNVDLDAFRHTDVDPKSIASVSGGNVNHVLKLTVDRGNGPEVMFFAQAQPKVPGNAEGPFRGLHSDFHMSDDGHMAERNVATYKLDQLLGFGLVPETGFASVQTSTGEILVGTAMKGAPGKSAQDVDTKSDGNWAKGSNIDVNSLKNTYKGDLAKFNEYYEKTGFIGRLNSNGELEMSRLEIVPHDIEINNPSLRQKSIKMQYKDALAGQVDRSQGNYFFRRNPDGTVDLTAIDNDLAWGTKPHDAKSMGDAAGSMLQLQFMGLPPIADQEIYDTFINMTDQDLETEFGGLLSDAQIGAAKGRLKAIQDHLQALPKNQIVQDWGAGADNVIDTHLDSGNCYLMRDAHFFKPATTTTTATTTNTATSQAQKPILTIDNE